MDNIKEENKFIKILKEYGPYLLVIILILLFKRFLYSPIRVNGDSMMSTLHDGDIMILDIIGYKNNGLKRFDIVVVDEGAEFIIKRVIGLPGEKVEYIDNELYINGEKMDDPYNSNETGDFSVTVPKDKYFVLGDNRNNSMDSRVFGSFSKKQIRGKTNFIVMPFSRYGKVEE